jgi:chromosome segregation ATPase
VRTRLKVVSAGATLALAAGAVAVGGGAPLQPAELARRAEAAAANAADAARNTAIAARRTEDLARIGHSVAAQVETSRRLLEIQLGVERSSEEGLKRVRALADIIGRIRKELDELQGRLRPVTSLSSSAGDNTRATSAAAEALEATLDRLSARFDEVVKESRELNRKARAFEELRESP